MSMCDHQSVRRTDHQDLDRAASFPSLFHWHVPALTLNVLFLLDVREQWQPGRRRVRAPTGARTRDVHGCASSPRIGESYSRSPKGSGDVCLVLWYLLVVGIMTHWNDCELWESTLTPLSMKQRACRDVCSIEVIRCDRLMICTYRMNECKYPSQSPRASFHNDTSKGLGVKGVTSSIGFETGRKGSRMKG